MTVAKRVRMRLRDAAGRRRSIMNIAYLILAHNNPGHLARLTQALATENSAIFIHIDKKADIRPFLELAGENVHFTSKRVPVYWGDYSQIEAILTLIDTAMAGSQRYDYLVLLSGSDYPLRTAAQLEAHFVKYRGSEFINMVAMPSEVASKPLSRLTDYKPRHGLKAILAAQVRRVLVKAGIISRTRDYKTWRAHSVRGQHLVGVNAGCLRPYPEFRCPQSADHEVLRKYHLPGRNGFPDHSRQFSL
jgi:Core-2/I-Branching enzyme